MHKFHLDDKRERYSFSFSILGLPLKVDWVGRVSDIIDEGNRRQFVDHMLKGPFSYWNHLHEFEAADGGTWMRDYIEYSLPLSFVGEYVLANYARNSLQRFFAGRQALIKTTFL